MTADDNAPPSYRVLAIDVDPALHGLLAEWLMPHGAVVTAPSRDASAADPNPDLIVVELCCPRTNGTARLQQLTEAHPDTPIVAVSSQFFPRIDCNGAVARQLGVAAVLPKPVVRDTLIAVVERLLRS